MATAECHDRGVQRLQRLARGGRRLPSARGLDGFGREVLQADAARLPLGQEDARRGPRQDVCQRLRAAHGRQHLRRLRGAAVGLVASAGLGALPGVSPARGAPERVRTVDGGSETAILHGPRKEVGERQERGQGRGQGQPLAKQQQAVREEESFGGGAYDDNHLAPHALPEHSTAALCLQLTVPRGPVPQVARKPAAARAGI
mmetsp:Transcript_108552/g.338390  ORF Transcript_108552/g.338390 Transcript_108552/m.338390 type:complete len:202 (+) Transcript_108552:198-803(+)